MFKNIICYRLIRSIQNKLLKMYFLKYNLQLIVTRVAFVEKMNAIL